MREETKRNMVIINPRNFVTTSQLKLDLTKGYYNYIFLFVKFMMSLCDVLM